MPPSALTAKTASLVSCTACHLLIRKLTGISDSLEKCPRCGATLHSRKPNSIVRTWSLILGAFLFYIPANLIPITKITSMGVVQTDTIMSGVIYFIATGMWPLALIIFVASIVVPLLKLIILTFLLISVQRRSDWRPKDRTRLYRLTETIGRWSMVDIFAVTILVALVHLGAIANIEAQKGVVFFAAVVVITMFAAMSFDPRLIWDTKEPEDACEYPA
jgi:paraquat-inducible protein A